MNHLMIDLETLGNGNNAAIASIGAVFFDPMTGELGSTFYQVVHIETSARLGDIDAGTVAWWMRQSSAARAIFQDKVTMPLGRVLEALRRFIIDNSKRGGVQVWGNGATFDCVILRNAFVRNGIPAPWKYFNDRDVRTVVEMGRTIVNIDPKKSMPFDGVQHNALDDARHQARYVSAIFSALTPATKEVSNV